MNIFNVWNNHKDTRIYEYTYKLRANYDINTYYKTDVMYIVLTTSLHYSPH